MHVRRVTLTPTVVAPLILVGVWVAFVYPTFFGKVRFPVDFAGGTQRGGEPARLANPDLGDAFYAEYPWHAYLGERLRDGAVPLWDPHRFGGTPFASTSTVAAWYPPNWLYASGAVLAVFTGIAVLSLLGALFLAYWFLRLVSLHPYAAALGAVTFTFSAFLIKWSAHDSILGSTMWLPLALGGVTLASRGQLRRGVCLGAAALALSVLAGHAQMALYVWTATAVWAAVLLGSSLLTDDGDRRGRTAAVARRAGAVAGMAALAVGLSAVLLVPLSRVAGLIVRSGTEYEVSKVLSLKLGDLPTLFLPDYWGSTFAGNFGRPFPPFIERSLYPGLLALPFAAVAVVRRRSTPVTLFFGALAVVGFLSVFDVLGFNRLLFALPGFSRTRFPTRSILYLDVGLAGLAAIGLDVLLTGRSRRDAALFVAGASVAALAVVGVVLVDRPPVSRSFLLAGTVWAIVVLAVGAVLVAGLSRRTSWSTLAAPAIVLLVAADLWLPGHRWHPFHGARPVVPVRPEVAYLRSVAAPRARFGNAGMHWVFPNFALNHGLYTVEGYDPFIIARMVNLISLAEDQRVAAGVGNFIGPFAPEAFRSPVMDLLGVRSVAARPGTPIAGSPAVTAGFSVVDRPAAFPPAFLATCAVQAPEPQDLVRLGAMTAQELRSTAVLSSRPPADLGAPPASACAPGPEAVVRTYEPERVVLETPDAGPGVLVLTDAWFPGWRVKVDGRSQPLLRVDHALRGVALPAGAHRVEFVYRPRDQVAGGVITGVSLLVLGAIALGPRLRRRTRSAPSQGVDDGPVDPRDAPQL